jgi:lipopolysaccharide export LptBFGC system permease protein LptF
MTMYARFVAALVGGVIGLVVTDLLNAAGLHWATWVVWWALLLFALVGTVIMRQRGSR